MIDENLILKLKKMTGEDEGSVTANYFPDHLYKNNFNGGKYFSLVSEERGQDFEMQFSPRIKFTVSFINSRDDINGVTIKKYKYNKTGGWVEDETEKITMSSFNFEKFIALLNFLKEIDLKAIAERRISFTDDSLGSLDAETIKKIKTLLAQKEGAKIIDELISSGIITSKDIVNTGYRKEQLRVFHDLMYTKGYLDYYRKENNIKDPRVESVWQYYFEKNPWIFGYGLSYVFSVNVGEERLEQTVSGSTFFSAGKRTDGLLSTLAAIQQFVLVEIKLPTTPLLHNQPRTECWATSSEVAEAIAQTQKTKMKFKEIILRNFSPKNKEGDPTGQTIYNFTPKSYLVIGHQGQFIAEEGINEDKYSSFQIYRESLRCPEIITFDELYERAKFIVEHSSK